jgi:hypothetical protein
MDDANLRDDRNWNRGAYPLRIELPRVVYELHIMRHDILPFLLSRRLTFPGGVPTVVKRPAAETDRRLGDWQRGMDLLKQALPRMTGETPASSALDDFRSLFHSFQGAGVGWCDDLLRPPEGPRYEIGDWPPLRWRIDVLGCWLPQERIVREILAWHRGEAAEAPDPWQELRRSFPEVSRKLLETPAGFNRLARWYTQWLPVLASIDPVFAVRAMDYDCLKNSPNADGVVAPLCDDFLASLVSCALAYMVTVMAGHNDFVRLGVVLKRPEVFGNWCGFMPGFLSAVLYHKVVVLRELAESV